MVPSAILGNLSKKYLNFKTLLQEVKIKDIITNIGLYHLGFCPKENVNGENFRFLGIISKNREEWGIADLACLRSSITIVPFFESLGNEGIAFILNQTQLTTICCEKRFLATIFKQKQEGKIEKVANIICFDEINEESRKQAEELGLKTY